MRHDPEPVSTQTNLKQLWEKCQKETETSAYYMPDDMKFCSLHDLIYSSELSERGVDTPIHRWETEALRRQVSRDLSFSPTESPGLRTLPQTQ